jgi:hypothetical protein
LLADTIKIGLAIAIVIFAIIGKVFKFSEWLEKYPNIKKIAESGTTYVVLLIVAILLLAGVFQDINAVREALNVPPPSPKAPPAPIIYKDEPPANLGNIAKNPSKSNAQISKTSGSGSPAIAQSGQNNIAQVGDYNKATINPESPEKSWVITDDICRQLIGAIRTTGSIQVSIGAFISDPDGANVVNQLARCLPLVRGWTVGMAVLPPVPEAVTVATSAENEPVATTLRDGLRTVGFDANLRLIPNTPDIEVWIGKHAFKTP